MMQTSNDLTAIKLDAIRYIDEGFAVMPVFSPSMVAPRDTLESIRNSPHLMAHIFCYLLSRLCKNPVKARFVISPISSRERAEKVFGKYRKAAISIALGRRSNLIVLDVDDMKNYKCTVNTRSVRTGHGQHFYFRYPENFTCSRKITADGIDLIGDRMRSNVPPSEHGCGKLYEWVNRELVPSLLPVELCNSRNAIICNELLVTALDITRVIFLGMVIFPLLKMSAPFLQKLITQGQCADGTSPVDPDMLAAARDYLKQGFVLIPAYSPLMFREIKIRSSRLRNWYCETGKSILRGRFYLKPLRTEEAVRNCFAYFPTANMHIITGVKSGIVVLDVDYDEGGLAALPPLNLPVTRSVSTGRGKHYYFTPPNNLRLPTVKDSIAPGVTLIGEMCSVVVPPSLHACGKRYFWDNPEVAIAPLPDNLCEMLKKQKPIIYWNPLYYFYIRKRFLAFPILRALLWWESFSVGKAYGE